ncbi:MAG TPA: CHAT domain-containing protein [Actinomycetes bacterium]|jgi:tetratricopeptide (TPR) repeat protein|nr:CHAT domain-containing protein [Actinomycetes bacterium]
MNSTIREQAREALRLAQGSPARSSKLASAVVLQARKEHDHVAGAVAERALGLAAEHLEDQDVALRHLRAAVALGRRAGSAQLAAEAQMTLAFLLSVRGQSGRALGEIDAAVSALRGIERVRARAQRAAILHQLGRLPEAFSEYRKTLRLLQDAGDLEWVQRVLSNRAVLHTFQQEFAAAEQDLQQAERVCARAGLRLSMAYVLENFGFLNAQRGDVVAALKYMGLAERHYRMHRNPLGSLLVDRSELLLSVRLVSEAREVAEQAVSELEAVRERIRLPEARLVLARAAGLDGDPDRALQEARRAVREFARHNRRRWVALARFAALTASLATDRLPQPSARQAERLADELAAARWHAAALDARLLAGRLRLDRGQTRQGCLQLQQASLHRERGPASLRARAWYGEALLRLTSGNRRGALRAVTAGLQILDEYQATLGATDLRARASGHRSELVELGLRVALQDGSPDRVLLWAERGRARHLLLRPVRPPDDPVLAHDLSELRATIAHIEQRRREGRSVAKLVHRQVALEREIRDHCRHQRGDASWHAVTARSLKQDLGEGLGVTALVEFVQLDQALHAVTVVDGSARLSQLGSMTQVQDLVDRLPFALRRLTRHHAAAASRSAAAVVLRHAAARLDDMLLRPLADQIGDRPVLVVPTGPLQSLPWSILPSLFGRPVSVSPSAGLWRMASRRPPASGGHVIAADERLPGARVEAEKVAAIYQTKAMLDPLPTVATLTDALKQASLVHLAVHGRLRADNPLFSSIDLGDGPLTAYDLESLEQTPHTVVLAACESGRAVVLAGDELLGLGATFLSRGTRQLIASVVTIPDVETAPLMIELHRLLAAGTPAAAALARAQQQVPQDHWTAVAAAAGFVCIGDGFGGALVHSR